MGKEITNKKKYINIYKWFFIIYCFLSLFCMTFIIVCIDEAQQYPELAIVLANTACLNIAPPIIIYMLSYFAKKYNWKPAVNIIVNLLFLPAALITYFCVPTWSIVYYWVVIEPY